MASVGRGEATIIDGGTGGGHLVWVIVITFPVIVSPINSSSRPISHDSEHHVHMKSGPGNEKRDKEEGKNRD